MGSWSTFGARTNHVQTQIHEIHHDPNLKEAITFPLKIYFVPSYRAYTQKSFFPGTPKLRVSTFPKLELLQF
jgi:hypothetical protein